MNSRLSSDLPQQNVTNLNPRFQKVSALHSKSRNHTSQFIDKEVRLDGASQSSYPVDKILWLPTRPFPPDLGALSDEKPAQTQIALKQMIYIISCGCA